MQTTATSTTDLVRRPPALFVFTRWTLVVWGAVVLSAALAARGWELDHLPGLNGDEAWLGVQAQRYLAGEPVCWRTPTGNPINPFHFWPMVWLHRLLPASVTVLRLPALISGLLALAVNYALCRRRMGLATALTSTLLLSVLPLNIAYSRFGWDACQSVLASVIVVFIALSEPRGKDAQTAVVHPPLLWLGLLFVAMLGAVLVHPTNLFLAPIAAIAAWAKVSKYCRESGIPRLQALANHRRAKACFLALLGLGLLFAAKPYWSNMLQHGATPGLWPRYIWNIAGLFSGSSIYRFIPGPDVGHPQAPVFSWIVVNTALVALLGWGGYSAWQNRRDPSFGPGGALFWGTAAGALAFFLVAGPQALAPHWERYGVWMVAPACLIMAQAIVRGMNANAWTRQVVPLGGLAWASLWLAGFYLHYFDVLFTTGGCSHAAFQTGPVEPKRLALAIIEQDMQRDQPAGQAVILAGDWFLYWPLAYLSHGKPVLVVPTDNPDAVRNSADVRRTISAAQAQGISTAIYQVEFISATAPQGHLLPTAHRLRQTRETHVLGYRGKHVLRVVRLED